MSTQDEIDLVVARLDLMPDKLRVIIDSKGIFNRQELQNHVREDDEVGRVVVAAHMMYLRSFKEEYRFSSIKPTVKRVPD